MNLKEALKEHNMVPMDLAKELNLSTSQIYKWIRDGISVNNKHFTKIRKILPELTPKEATIRKDGETEDLRFKAGRPKKEIDLDSLSNEVTVTHSDTIRSSLFPKITIKKEQKI